MNVLRTLVLDDEVSLTVIDGTSLAREGKRLHGLNKAAASFFSRQLLFTAFLSACLKGEKGEVSLSVKGDGQVGNVSVSGNFDLHIRGSIDQPAPDFDGEDAKLCFANQGTLTIIRDDGYARPFVGVCGSVEGDMDDNFSEYFAVSEQLPTFIKTQVDFDENDEISFAGIVVMQPLPFASEKAVQTSKDKNLLSQALAVCKQRGVSTAAQEIYGAKQEKIELKKAIYRCNCSKHYLLRVLVSVGKPALDEIIKEEGAVKIHCHYCNKDYLFDQADVDKLFL